MHPLVPILESLATDGSEPGAAVCVVREGDVEVEHQVGTRDRVARSDPATLVMTYSVAKPYAALTVLPAVAEAALRLDQPVADVWPDYAVAGKADTTVRHVLPHSAGLASFPEAASQVAY